MSQDNNIQVQATPEDIEKNKVYAALAYIPILFWLPLVVCKDSVYGKFHANQGLLLLILSVAVGILSVIPIIGFIGGLLGIVEFVFFIMGLVNALQGNMKGLPFIDSIELIK